jgi:hypothetical protein
MWVSSAYQSSRSKFAHWIWLASLLNLATAANHRVHGQQQQLPRRRQPGSRAGSGDPL